jgi:hypothetical protein
MKVIGHENVGMTPKRKHANVPCHLFIAQPLPSLGKDLFIAPNGNEVGPIECHLLICPQLEKVYGPLMRLLPALSLAAGVVLAGRLSAGDAPTPIPLGYQFTSGQTNAYRVDLETVTGDQTSALAGVIFVHVRKVEEGVATVGLSGSLMPRPGGEMGPMFGRPPGPLGEMWRPRPVVLQPNHELSVNALGQVVRQRSVAPGVPTALGSVNTLFFQSVPEAPSFEWRSESEVWIEDETATDDGPMRHHAPYADPRFGHLLAVTRTEAARFKEVTEAAVTIESKIELASRIQSAGAPRLKASAERQIVFDRRTGWIRSAEIRGQSWLTTAYWTLRRPVTLRLRFLEGDDLAKELASLQPVESPPAKITSTELTGLLRDLESHDEAVRMTAIQRFQVAEVDEVTPELLAAAVKLAASPNFPERVAAGRLLGRYGTTEQVPAMLKLVAWSQPGNQREVLDALARLKDPRAIGPLADSIARGNFDSDYIVQVLRGFGPAAELAALSLFKERHTQTRRQACVLLGEVGTRKSAESLREMMLDPDEQIAQTAAQALRAIQQREADAAPVP